MNFIQKYLTPLCCAAGFSAMAMLTACGGSQGRDPILGLPATTLSALAVTPASAAIASGAKQQLTATATYSDGSTRDVSTASAWSSATPASASVGAATGLATGVAPGTAAITAAFGGKTASANLVIGPVALTSLAVAPQSPIVQIGATRQLAVNATYSDASTADVTATSVFVSATPASATVGANGGLVTGVAAGSSPVTASVGGMSANTTISVPAVTLASIAVTPGSASVTIGGQQQFIATATYSDASNAVIKATWSSTTPGNASVQPGSGLATGIAAGTTTISASLGGISGSALLTVSAIAIPPVITSLDLGRAASFAVLAGTSITNNSGGTTLVTGDVGAPSQTVDPTQAAGYTNYKSGAILSGALADLQTAITSANGRSCDVSFAGGIDLGGQTFGPGVYCYSGAISITGTLTLNGPGVYIFRTALTLNSTANSIVALNNGATAADVNWLPVGPTTLGANSVFKGNILGQSAAITIGDNTTLLNGRVLTAAAVTLRNNQITK